MQTDNCQDISEFARRIRIISLQLTHKANASHIGGVFSMAEILAVLYGRILNIENPSHPLRDRFFLSKGHACAGLYAALAIKGFVNTDELLEQYGTNGSKYMTHASISIPGIELSTGSLGHAAGVACGVALAAVRRGLPYKVYVMLSDGELDEGSNWEAFLFAAHHRLSNITFIIDFNKIQSLGNTADVMNLEPLADKFRAFNFEVYETNGHNIPLLLDIFQKPNTSKPRVVIAHTVKGKGVDFMENTLMWHYKSVDTQQLENAIQQLNQNA